VVPAVQRSLLGLPELLQRQCADGWDNDGDGWKDYPADPQCKHPSGFREASPSDAGCGLGFELVFLMPLLMRLRGRRRRATA